MFKHFETLNIHNLYKFDLIKNNYFNDNHKVKAKERDNRRQNTSYHKFIIPKTNNNYGERELRYKIPTVFNELSEPLLSISTLANVKKAVKNWLNNQ